MALAVGVVACAFAVIVGVTLITEGSWSGAALALLFGAVFGIATYGVLTARLEISATRLAYRRFWHTSTIERKDVKEVRIESVNSFAVESMVVIYTSDPAQPRVSLRLLAANDTKNGQKWLNEVADEISLGGV